MLVKTPMDCFVYKALVGIPPIKLGQENVIVWKSGLQASQQKCQRSKNLSPYFSLTKSVFLVLLQTQQRVVSWLFGKIYFRHTGLYILIKFVQLSIKVSTLWLSWLGGVNNRLKMGKYAQSYKTQLCWKPRLSLLKERRTSSLVEDYQHFCR